MRNLLNHDQLPETIQVKVTPRAKQVRIKVEQAPDGTDLYRVYVTAPAENGKANEAVIALLAESFGVAKSSLSLELGYTGRLKTVRIHR
jgi:uncharacterized protein YggU (UPF0235/DUF167 family)